MNHTDRPATGAIHVMHVLTDTNIGGAGTLLCNQLAAFDLADFSFAVVLPRNSALISRLSALPHPPRLFFTAHGQDRSADPHAVSEYLRLFRTYRPDIVHTHAALSARIAAKLAHIPCCIHTRHCVFPLSPRQQNALYRMAFRSVNHYLSDGIIAVAHAAKEQLCDLGLKESDIRVIINGVNPVRRSTSAEVEEVRRSLNLPSDAFIVGMMARLEDYKGQSTLLNAAARCLAEPDGEKIYILLCGDGSKKDELLSQAQHLGIEDHLRLVGFCEDVAPMYALMDVNVNASYGTETSSLSLSEGMSVGIPAIASTFGGNPYMVRAGYNGLLFPPKDDKKLAGAVLTLYRHPDRLLVMGQNAEKFYHAHLTARNMADQMADYYREQWQKKQKSRQFAP